MLFRVLGSVVVERAGREIRLPGGRERCLLCVLLLAAGQPVPTDRLIDLLWAEEPPAGARAAIHTYVSRLRRTLAAHIGTAEAALSRRGDCYVLAVDPDLVDIHRFANLVKQACHIDDPSLRAPMLRRALELWRGPVAADVRPSELRQRIAGQKDQLRVSAMRLCIEAELASGQHQAVIDELTYLVDEHPLDEELAGQLMLALHRSGRRSDALHVYQQTRARLADDLSLDPSDRLRELHVAILRADPSLQLGGVHEPGRTVPIPPSGPHGRVPAQLPAPPAEFTGRTVHLDQLDALLGRACAMGQPLPVVISAISGLGGVGKTALAVHWGHLRSDKFPDGQLYVDLGGWASGPPLRPSEAIARLLRGLGVPADEIPMREDEAGALYRTSLVGRRALVLLDNAVSAEQVRPLLPGEPACMVIVTSRSRLGGLAVTHGAHHLNLDVLAADEGVELIRRVIGASRAARNEAVVRDVARLCGNLPLALRIAAASIAERPSISLDQYLAELASGDRLAVLAVHGDGAASIAPTFAMSYAHLPEAERRLLRLLGVFPGSHITTSAAAALADVTEPSARSSLEALVGTNLLESRGLDRYATHDLVRLYAAGRAGAEEPAHEWAAALRRLVGWYEQTAADAARVLLKRTTLPSDDRAKPDPVEAGAWCEAELDNIVAIIDEAWRRGWHETVWRLPAAVWPHLQSSVTGVDWVAIHRRAVHAAGQAGNKRARASAQHNLGQAHRRLGEASAAVHELERAADEFRVLGDTEELAGALTSLGEAHYAAGNYTVAHEHLRSALQLGGPDHPSQARAEAFRHLGVTLRAVGDNVGALGACQDALAVYRTLGDERGEANTINNIGNVLRRMGKPTDARAHYEDALPRCRRLGDRRGEANTLNNLGLACLEAGELVAAGQFLRTALELFRAAGARMGQATALSNIAVVLRNLGRYAEAVDHHQQALDLCLATGDRGRECELRNELGTTHHLHGQPDLARTQHRTALAIATEIGYRHEQVRAEEGLADAGGKPQPG